MKRDRNKTARRSRRSLKLPSPRVLRLAAIAAGIGAVVGPAAYIARAGLPAALNSGWSALSSRTLDVSARMGLSVQEILVDGRSETAAADVLAVLEVSRNSPILEFHPAEARVKLEKLPWVKTASVERWLPNTIYVRLTEREPLALWQRHGRLTLVDADGVEIRAADIARFSRLPVIVGDDAPAHAASLVALLSTEPDLAQRVTAAVRVGGRRWNVNLEMRDGRTVEAQLPEINPAAAWTKLADLERSNGLLERNIVTVDLRLPDRLVVRVLNDAPPANGKRKTEKKST